MGGGAVSKGKGGEVLVGGGGLEGETGIAEYMKSAEWKKEVAKRGSMGREDILSLIRIPIIRRGIDSHPFVCC